MATQRYYTPANHFACTAAHSPTYSPYASHGQGFGTQGFNSSCQGFGGQGYNYNSSAQGRSYLYVPSQQICNCWAQPQLYGSGEELLGYNYNSTAPARSYLYVPPQQSYGFRNDEELRLR
ncbi:hypothetical protein T484DRAFT_1794741 [Baffinella frigidus]|nr:hypothetical protein T484DRAFT_1794741 [Cryptophyta sp. CCMP2293]